MYNKTMAKKKRIDFAFIVQPRDVFDIYRKYPFAKIFPQRLVLFVFRFFPPVFVGSVLVRTKKKNLRGGIISVSATAKMLLADRKKGRRKVEDALRYAARLGARYAGLGSLTSPVVGGGKDVCKPKGLFVTNGNALTAGMTIVGVQKLIQSRGKNIEDLSVAVVGATGSIGNAVSRMLAEMHPRSLLLLGRTPENLSVLREDIFGGVSGISVDISTNMDDVRHSDVVVVAVSASGAIIRQHHLKENAIVYDITQPQNVSEDILKERPDITVVDGALVRFPAVSHRFDFGIPQDAHFSCFSELILCSLEDVSRDFSIGTVRTDNVREILALAEKYGVEIAPFTSFGKPLS